MWKIMKYIPICVYIFIYTYAQTSVHWYKYILMCMEYHDMYINMWIYICRYTCINIGMSIRVYLYIYVYLPREHESRATYSTSWVLCMHPWDILEWQILACSVPICVNACVHTYIYKYMCVYTCVYMYMHMEKERAKLMYNIYIRIEK